MKRSPLDFLSIVEHESRPKSQKKYPEKEIATIARDLIKKIGKPSSRSQIIQELKGLGYTDLESNQVLRKLEDNHEIFVVQDSSSLKVVLHKDTSSYDHERSKLQQAWIKAKEEGI